MRIIFIEMLGKGGLVHYDYHLCRALFRSGVEISLVTSKEYELENLDHEFPVIKMLQMWDPRMTAPKNPFARKVRRASRGVRYILQLFRLIFYLIRKRPDIVFLGEIRFGFELYFIRLIRLFGLKTADIVHDVQLYDTSTDPDSIIKQDDRIKNRYNMIYQSFDALFVHGKYSYDTFLSLYNVSAHRVHQIPFGTNEIVIEETSSCTSSEMKKKLGIPEDKNVLLFFGTLNKYKGVDDLVEAFFVARKKCDAHLVIAGFPAKDIGIEALKQSVRDKGLADHVSWYLEYIPNHQVKPIFELSGIVILPYKAITQSGVLQIAFSCGRPVIGTMVGGLPDVIVDGETGLLVPPGDHQAMADAIARLLSEPAKLAQMGARAKILSQTQYSWKNIAEKIRETLEVL